MKGEAVRRRLRMPTRFRVGERPAGAERGEDFETDVLSFGSGDRAVRIGRRGDVAVFREEKSLVGDGGALVRKKLTGLTTDSLLLPSGHLERLGERKMTGSTFSASSSSSKDAALRFTADEGVDRAIGRRETHGLLKERQGEWRLQLGERSIPF